MEIWNSSSSVEKIFHKWVQAPESTNIFLLQKARFFDVAIATVLEACVAERLTPRTLDLEVRGSSLARRVVSLDKELYSTLSLFT